MKDEKKSSLWQQMSHTLAADEMFHETEVQANRLGAQILIASGIVLALTMLCLEYKGRNAQAEH